MAGMFEVVGELVADVNADGQVILSDGQTKPVDAWDGSKRVAPHVDAMIDAWTFEAWSGDFPDVVSTAHNRAYGEAVLTRFIRRGWVTL